MDIGVNLKPVVVDFEVHQDIERLSQTAMDKVDTAVNRVTGWIQHEDGDTIRIVYREEGLGRKDYDCGPEFCSVTVPKDSILAVHLPFDVEVVDYLDHVSFGRGKDKTVPRIVPLRCTVYGRIQEETDDYVRLIHFEKDIEGGKPTYDGIVILKSTIFNRETTKAEPEPEEQEPLRVHV